MEVPKCLPVRVAVVDDEEFAAGGACTFWHGRNQSLQSRGYQGLCSLIGSKSRLSPSRRSTAGPWRTSVRVFMEVRVVSRTPRTKTAGQPPHAHGHQDHRGPSSAQRAAGLGTKNPTPTRIIATPLPIEPHRAFLSPLLDWSMTGSRPRTPVRIKTTDETGSMKRLYSAIVTLR